MRPGLQPGQTGELTWIVDPTMTITLGLLPQATVFSTPNMIMLMERAAREALRPFLEDGEESVGIEVNVEHLGPAVLGDTVRGVAKVTAVDGRRVGFDIQCFAGDREIGRGKHRRAVVQLGRLLENLNKVCGDQGIAMNLEPNTGDLPELETLSVDVAGQVATITLNRPQSLNAVDTRMTDDWERVIAWLAGHPQEVRVVIVTGAGKAFCAGDDLKELAALDAGQARRLSLRQANMYLAFERLPQPFIAAVNGPAMGAGGVCAYSCDLRVAAQGATFGMPEITLGWPPGYGVAQLTALVGKARALELCTTGRTINARQALEWGLVNEVAPNILLLKRVRQIAEGMLALPAEALRETKRLIHADEGSLPKVTHRADTEAYVRCFETSDAQEGIAAFVAKRKPKFTGP
jgi:enoyl-CoA hydratase